MFSLYSILPAIVFWFSRIQYNVCEIFCDSDSQWIIIEDADIEDQYFEFRSFKLNTEHYNEEDGRGVDIFYTMTPDELDATCSKLRSTQIYQRIPLGVPFPDPFDIDVVSDIIENKENVKDMVYGLRPLKTRSEKISVKVPVFPCETHKHRTYWLTYGFSTSAIYLLREVDDGKAVSFVGRSERLPKVDEKTPKGIDLDTYFMEVLHDKTKSSTYSFVGTDVNPFASSALVRACCLVHALRERRVREKKSFLMNFANGDPITRIHLPIKILETGKYEEASDAVGCAINRKKEDDFDFYIYADGKTPDALFVLEKIEEPGKDAKLVVFERLIGIPQQTRYGIYHL